MAALHDDLMDADMRPEVLEARLAEVENSIEHLMRSNRELAAALSEDGEDPDFRQAINENVEVILRRHELAAEIRRIMTLSRERRAVATAGTAAEPVAAPASRTAAALPVEATAVAAAAALAAEPPTLEPRPKVIGAAEVRAAAPVVAAAAGATVPTAAAAAASAAASEGAADAGGAAEAQEERGSVGALPLVIFERDVDGGLFL